MARLVIVQGEGGGTAHALPAWAVVVGRGEECDVVLADPRASRRHVCVRCDRGAWFVRDLDTHNGTFVDGRRIAPGWAPLRDGARLRVGRTVFLFEDDEAGDGGVETSVPRLPGYEVLEAVGEGATGRVWRARHLTLDRTVAIKVLAPHHASSPELVERFVAEARATAALSHPNIVPVFEVSLAGTAPHFTMEFMEGGTVADLLHKAHNARLPWREAVRIASAAAEGLAFLHAHGLVHRDVKPANVLLGARGEVKLGDLGTVVRADEAEAARIGTPHFMSPEQARREPVTRASDVYSLGATLYRMLAGRPPHRGSDVRRILEAVAKEAPAPLERLCPGLPPEVVAAVREMMSPDPAARPRDAAEVGRRLAAALGDVATSRATARRRRRLRDAVPVWILGLLAATVVAAVAWCAFTEEGRDAVVRAKARLEARFAGPR